MPEKGVSPRVRLAPAQERGAEIAASNVVPIGSQAPPVPSNPDPYAPSEAIARHATPDELRVHRLWNELAARSHVCPGWLDLDRLHTLRTRMREYGGLVPAEEALGAVEASPIWQGRRGRGWKPTFDDFLSAAKFRMLIEGGYPADGEEFGEGGATPSSMEDCPLRRNGRF